MVDPETWIENGMVGVSDGQVVSVGKASPYRKALDHGPGIIMPSLGNGHTHLGLSALEGRIGTKNGFVAWVEDLITLRDTLSPDKAREAATAAAMAMKESGVGLAAEVGPIEPGAHAMKKNGIKGIVFLESLGAEVDPPELPSDEGGILFTWAGHAPHTTGPKGLRVLKAAADHKGKLFGLHLAESTAEVEFLVTGRGEWAKLMARRGHDCSRWEPWGERPVERAHRLGLLDSRTIAVHLLEITPVEMDILVRTGTRVCLCPCSNLALHNKLPDIEGFIRAGLKPAIGTDSLASAPSLSIFDEMRFIAEHYPALRPETILRLGTVNTARVLDHSELGSLRPGHPAHMIYVHLMANSQKMASEALVSGGLPKVEWL